MGSCGFSGPIPQSLAALPSVAYVDLSNNALSGPVPEFTSPYISTLLLQSNLLTASDVGSLDFLVRDVHASSLSCL
jgi:hypothetical protein